MRKRENECVGCPPERGCLGSACPHRDVLHIYCDACGDEGPDIYTYDGRDYCAECLISRLAEEGIVEAVEEE